MLTRLSIRNVVLIEALDLDVSGGLTALTGETGAGKSIILDSLGMATGARSDRGLVRSGADKAQCTAVFEPVDGHPVWALLEEAEHEADPRDPLILRRSIGADGRSRAFVNDAPVSVTLLSAIGDSLLEVHGQHDGRGLLDPKMHIHMLDAHGGLGPQLAACHAAHAAKVEAEKWVKTLEANAAKSSEDKEFFSHAIEELDRLAPVAGEDEELTARRRFLQGAESALEELGAAEAALGEDGEFEDRLSMALAGIERVQGKLGDSDNAAADALQQAAEALEKAMLETQEARSAVVRAAETFDVEPGELDAAERRLFALKAAARKFGTNVESLIDKRREFEDSLSEIENFDANLKAAKKELKDLTDRYDDTAAALTAGRRKAAADLDKSVAEELGPLKMERAVFETRIEPAPPSSIGADKVRFEVSTNPGTPRGPLDKIASGGELARFALAIKVALAGTGERIMVFDEVDQGVGGAVASAVGRRLSRLSKDSQVFVVTHSPQVAACADHQFRIEKRSAEQTTTTTVRAIDEDEREEEIARMLAGESITQEARAAARQLMKAS